MIAIGECADEANQLRENRGGNRISPFKPEANAVERAQDSLDHAVFVLKGVQRFWHRKPASRELPSRYRSRELAVNT